MKEKQKEKLRESQGLHKQRLLDLFPLSIAQPGLQRKAETRANITPSHQHSWCSRVNPKAKDWGRSITVVYLFLLDEKEGACGQRVVSSYHAATPNTASLGTKKEPKESERRGASTRSHHAWDRVASGASEKRSRPSLFELVLFRCVSCRPSLLGLGSSTLTPVCIPESSQPA